MENAVVVSVSSLMVAFSSLVLSGLNFRRDRGTLSVFVGIGTYYSLALNRSIADVVQLKVTNVGRRPVAVVGLYGDLKEEFLNRCLTALFGHRTPKRFQARGLMLTNKEILKGLSDGESYKTVLEGQTINISIQGETGLAMARELAKSAASLYVLDSTGRRHYVRAKVLNKLNLDLQQRNDENT
ncbi:MAG: hypothetical protein EOP06_12505 [Proteobacteria bacterium]|nr:MAG: hypothetical protein EOP06_12505 [Pseudomonadota bacterium]